jgi:hypothetical protein
MLTLSFHTVSAAAIAFNPIFWKYVPLCCPQAGVLLLTILNSSIVARQGLLSSTWLENPAQSLNISFGMT